jgi:uncharacterized membrane protein
MAAALCVMSVCWAAILSLAPLGRSTEFPRVVRSLVAPIPYAIGRLVCHQRPERSFVTRAVPWPVCARCAGLYLSAALAIVGVFLAPGIARDPTIGSRAWRFGLTVAAMPTLVSWAAERADWWMPTSAMRAMLAVPLGVAIGALLASVARHSGPGAARNLR